MLLSLWHKGGFQTRSSGCVFVNFEFFILDLVCSTLTWSPAFYRVPCPACSQQRLREPYFQSLSDSYLRIPGNMFRPCWCRLRECSRTDIRDRILCLFYNGYFLDKTYSTFLVFYYLMQHLKTPPPFLQSLANLLFSCFRQSSWHCSASNSCRKPTI